MRLFDIKSINYNIIILCVFNLYIDLYDIKKKCVTDKNIKIICTICLWYLDIDWKN